MLEYLSEDAMLPAGFLLLLAGLFVVAMRTSQQGKYLAWAIAAATMAAAVIVVEWVWVTDNERVEQVVYGLRDAVARSDVVGVLAYMAPDVMYLKGDVAMEGDATRALISDNLSRARFELVRVTNLQTNVARQSRRGTATFGVTFKGTSDGSFGSMNFGAVNTLWSLGLAETAPGVWKVNRITPVQVPGGGLSVPGGGRGRGRR